MVGDWTRTWLMTRPRSPRGHFGLWLGHCWRSWRAPPPRPDRFGLFVVASAELLLRFTPRSASKVWRSPRLLRRAPGCVGLLHLSRYGAGTSSSMPTTGLNITSRTKKTAARRNSLSAKPPLPVQARTCVIASIVCSLCWLAVYSSNRADEMKAITSA